MRSEADSLIKNIIRHRSREAVEHLDSQRELVKLQSTNVKQEEIAEALGISQSAVSQRLKTAQKVPAIPEGFSGGSPMEICERFAAGLLSREQVIDELTRWEYPAEAMPADIYDDIWDKQPGDWMEVEQAARLKLIDWDIYEEVLKRIEA
jgi:DNA-binding transcriptional regulator YdaS (Cro superfamily)